MTQVLSAKIAAVAWDERVKPERVIRILRTARVKNAERCES